MKHHTTDPNQRAEDIADHEQKVRDDNPSYYIDDNHNLIRSGDWPGDWLDDYKQIQLEMIGEQG